MNPFLTAYRISGGSAKKNHIPDRDRNLRNDGIREIKTMLFHKKFTNIVLLGLTGAGLLATPFALFADTETNTETNTETVAESQSTVEALRAQIEALDEKLRILERKQELSDEGNSAEFKKIPTIKADDKGLTVESKDKAFQFRLRGLLQTDFRSYVNSGEQNASLAPGQFTPTDQNDGFVLRRVRPRFQGKLYDRLSFEFMPELTWSNGTATGNSVRLLNLYGDYKIYDELNFKFGLFKTPIGLERLQSPGELSFLERGLPTNLGPARDIGLQIHGKTWNEQFSYNAGLFNGTVSGDDSRGNLDGDEGLDFMGSVFLEPFKKDGPLWLQGLGFGLAGSVGDNDSANTTTTGTRLRYRSAGQDPFFDTNTANAGFDGLSYRINPQLYYYYGPFGLLSEYIISSYEIAGRTAASANSRGTVESDSFVVQVGYVLTGEDATYKGVKPDRPISFSEGGGWGAFELVSRFNFLSVSDDAFRDLDPTAAVNRFALGGSASDALSYGIGLNWYLNNNFKIQVAYDHTEFDGYSDRQNGVGNGQGDRPSEDVVAARFQVAF
jgi:phosphate-selective porin OprO and OprP